MSQLGSIISSTKTQLLLANEEELGVHISVAQRYIVKMMYTMMVDQEWDYEDTTYALEEIKKFCGESSFYQASEVAENLITLEKKMEGV